MANHQRPEWFPAEAWERTSDAEKQLAVEQPDSIKAQLIELGIISAEQPASAAKSPASVTSAGASNVTRAVAQSFSAVLDQDKEFIQFGMDVEKALDVSNQKALRCLLFLEKHFPVKGGDDAKSLLRFPKPGTQDKDRTKAMYASNNAHHYHFPNPNDQTKSVNGDFYMDLAVGLSRGKELQGEIDSLKAAEKPETRGTAKKEHQGMTPNDRKSALDLSRQRLNAWKNTIVTSMEVFYRRIELEEAGFKVQWYMPGGSLAGHKKCVTIAVTEPQINSARISVGEFRAFKPAKLSDKAFLAEHKGDKFAALLASAAKAPTEAGGKGGEVGDAKMPDVGSSIDQVNMLSHCFEKADWVSMWYKRATSKTRDQASTDEAKSLVAAYGGLWEELNAIFGEHGKPEVKSVYEQTQQAHGRTSSKAA